MSKVSIIITCFNTERFVDETIESALRQTYRDLEVIVIDDGSTDKSRSIIERFGTRLTSVFGPNRGASAARNRGTQVATGEFIQYLDADDLLAPHAVSDRVEALRHANADVAYSDWQRLIEQEGKFEPGEIVTHRMESVHSDPEIATFSAFWSPPAALLYRRRIVEKIGTWNDTLPIIQDARFLQDAALHGGRFIHVPGVSAFYRVHKGQSLSKKDKHAFVRDCLQNALQVQSWWRDHGKFDREHRDAVLTVFSQVARSSFESDHETFNIALQAANRLQPGWIPTGPPALHALSQIIGYPNAERCASTYRRLKRIFFGASGT